jgi:hypothetical protein
MYFPTIIPSISFYLFTLPMYFFSIISILEVLFLPSFFSIPSFPFFSFTFFLSLDWNFVGLISISFVSFFLFILFITKHVELWSQKKKTEIEKPNR